MKKILSVLVALMLALSALGMTAVAEEKPLIGILAPATSHGWVGGVAYFAQQAADELELNYKLVTSSDADEMSSQIENMIQLGAKAIVVWPQFTGVETAAEMALEKGIIIYNFDMKINVDEKYADNMYVLTGDNYGMGVAGAKYIVDKIGTEGTVLIMDVPTSGNVADGERSHRRGILHGRRDLHRRVAGDRRSQAHGREGHHRRRRMPGVLRPDDRGCLQGHLGKLRDVSAEHDRELH